MLSTPSTRNLPPQKRTLNGTLNVGELIDENTKLCKRLVRLEQEKAILKKAATYFAKELR